MIVSVKDLCAQNDIPINDTIYENSSADFLDFRIVSGDFYTFTDSENGKKLLKYKNCLDIIDYPMLTACMPSLLDMKFKSMERYPYFTTGLSEMRQRIESGERIAVEGGPCLFGTNEVTIEVIKKDGSKAYFDFNTAKSYSSYGQLDETMVFSDFVASHAGEIKALHFENKKTGITPQEWAFTKYPFEIARCMDAPLVITIPDMSYEKYLNASLSLTDESVRESAMGEFHEITAQISDMYLSLIHQMHALYPNTRLEILHGRDVDICKRFYEGRSPYMDRNKIDRILTGIPEKFESVKDYVSMPALPFYLYGISNVIEVNSMDETDSYRKCKKAHKGSLNLACILFPELLAKDQIHTIFDAPWDQKEYGNYVAK